MSRNYHFSVASQANIDSTSLMMQRVCERALMIANKRKTICHDFGIVSGYRSAETQFELFKQGRTFNDTNGKWEVTGKTVTNCDGYLEESNHQSYNAIDFVVWYQGSISEDPAHYALVATCFYEAAADLNCEGEWGGCYQSLSDLGHFDIKLKAR